MKIEKPGPEEKEIVGKWEYVDGRMIADANCERIEHLVNDYLKEIGYSKFGAWETLYQDPDDGRYWESIYPQGEMQGGGPPALYCLSTAEARAKYPQLFGKSDND